MVSKNLLSKALLLTVSDNHLATLPPEIGNLSHLTELYGTLPNFLSSINVYSGSQLIIVIASRNREHFNPHTTLWSDNIHKFISMWAVSHNMLWSLPQEIGNLSKLTQLYGGPTPFHFTNRQRVSTS